MLKNAARRDLFVRILTIIAGFIFGWIVGNAIFTPDNTPTNHPHYPIVRTIAYTTSDAETWTRKKQKQIDNRDDIITIGVAGLALSGLLFLISIKENK